jgi:peptidyl-prolyl cis-trans isomerase SurA
MSKRQVAAFDRSKGAFPEKAKLAAAGALSLLLILSACKTPVSSDVAATVNGRPITYADLDRAMATQSNATVPTASDDQGTALKLEILRALIDKEILLQRAEKAGLMAVDADVEARFNEVHVPYGKDDFQKQLQARKMTESDFKAQIRKELSIQKLFNKEIGSHISISDQDVASFYNANKAEFNQAEARVHLAQILVTPLPSTNVHNLKSDKAQNEDQAKKKIQMIELRLKQGDEFGVLAQNYSEDPGSAANGGDMGFIPESALANAAPELRRVIMTMPPGQITPVIQTVEGYRLIKVIAKEPAGQRELNDPRVQEGIRAQLFNLKDQLWRDAYIETSRNEARVVNYFAQSILANRDKH